MTKEEVIYELDHSNRAVNVELDKQYNSYLLGKASAYDEAIELVKEIDKPERKRGRWIEKSKWQSGRWIKWFECSICGEKDYNAEMYEDMPFTGLSNFCPNCGADMRGESE